MPLSADLLKPIDGNNPSGVDVRYDTKLLIYDKINEARRQDDGLAQGDWQQERKVANYPVVVKLAQDALATKTKDLQLAAWLTEAMLHTEGFSGLAEGLSLCHGLISDFWETVYPLLEDGDEEKRAAPLDWLGTSLEVPLKNVPLVRAGYDWFKYTESRLVGYEDQVQGDKEKKIRAQRIAEGKLAPEVFDKAFAGNPKTFYLQSEKQLDGCLAAVKRLEELCDKTFQSAAPSFGKLKKGLEEVRHTVHGLLERKRETEPDSVEDNVSASASPGAEMRAAAGNETGAEGMSIVISVLTSAEPAERREVIASVARAAAFLRQT